MKSPTKRFWVKFLALFTVVRGYNIALLVIALYFTAFFIFSKNIDLQVFIKNIHLHLIIIASAFTVSAGYIINNFYDAEKDRIGRPISSFIAKFVSQNFKLGVYLFFNILALILALSASWRVALFFIVYQFLMWFYSHKLNKIVFINNLTSTILSLFPFLALLLYYNEYSYTIFLYAFFLGITLLMVDLTKDFLTIKADIIYNYSTLPIVLGERKSKIVVSLFSVFAMLFAISLSLNSNVGYMRFYFQLSYVVLFFISIAFFFVKKRKNWLLLHLILKILLGLGVLSLAWIKINPLDLQKFFEI